MNTTTMEEQRTPKMTDLVPTWDPERRELRLGGKLVKHFRWPAANQECVLRAFQEEGWVNRIDDPLQRTDVDPKARLHDTIKCLNKNQENKLIRFRGDGTGQGVLWEVREEPTDESEPVAQIAE